MHSNKLKLFYIYILDEVYHVTLQDTANDCLNIYPYTTVKLLIMTEYSSLLANNKL